MLKTSEHNSSKKMIGARMKEFLSVRFENFSVAAEAFGKTPTYFHSYFRGVSMPGGDVLAWLAEQGCNTNWLLSGEGAMLMEDEEERQRQEKYAMEQAAQARATPLHYVGGVRAGYPDTVTNPPNQVIAAAEIIIMNDHTLVYITPEGERIMVVKTITKDGKG